MFTVQEIEEDLNSIKALEEEGRQRMKYNRQVLKWEKKRVREKYWIVKKWTKKELEKLKQDILSNQQDGKTKQTWREESKRVR